MNFVFWVLDNRIIGTLLTAKIVHSLSFTRTIENCLFIYFFLFAFLVSLLFYDVSPKWKCFGTIKSLWGLTCVHLVWKKFKNNFFFFIFGVLLFKICCIQKKMVNKRKKIECWRIEKKEEVKKDRRFTREKN